MSLNIKHLETKDHPPLKYIKKSISCSAKSEEASAEDVTKKPRKKILKIKTKKKIDTFGLLANLDVY